MPPSSRRIIRVTVISRREGGCTAGCGADWADPATLALAKARLKERFGARARLEHFDAASPALPDEVRNKTAHGDVGLPVLLIDGVPRIAGEFDIRALLDAVETELEIKL